MDPVFCSSGWRFRKDTSAEAQWWCLADCQMTTTREFSTRVESAFMALLGLVSLSLGFASMNTLELSYTFADDPHKDCRLNTTAVYGKMLRNMSNIAHCIRLTGLFLLWSGLSHFSTEATVSSSLYLPSEGI